MGGVMVRDRIHEAMRWLRGQQEAHVAREVTYVRGADRVTITATLARTRTQQLDTTGMLRTVYVGRDYLIRPADLVLGGQSSEPRKGDRIIDVGDDGGEEVYEVQPTISGEPVYEQDAYGTRWRVHTKRVR